MRKFIFTIAAVFAITVVQTVYAMPMASLANKAFSVGSGFEFGGGTGELPTNCTNFTGVWKGVCKDSNGKVFEQNNDVKQFGCSMLISDNTPTYIGGLKTETASFPVELQEGTIDAAYTMTSTTEWNEARTELVSKFRAMAKVNVTKDGSKTPVFISVDGESNMKLVDGKTVATVDYTINGVKGHYDCETVKQ